MIATPHLRLKKKKIQLHPHLANMYELFSANTNENDGNTFSDFFTFFRGGEN